MFKRIIAVAALVALVAAWQKVVMTIYVLAALVAIATMAGLIGLGFIGAWRGAAWAGHGLIRLDDWWFNRNVSRQNAMLDLQAKAIKLERERAKLERLNHKPLSTLNKNEFAIMPLQAEAKQIYVIDSPALQALPTPCDVPTAAALPSNSGGVLVGYHEQSNNEIRRDVFELCHLLAVGRSGSGKSVLARSLAYELYKQNQSELIFTDLEGITFNPFARVATMVDSVEGFSTVLSDTLKLIEARKKQFAMYPDCEKLSEYNGMASDKLLQRVLFVDEFSALLSLDSGLEKSLKQVLWRGRKYGIYVFAFAQSVKHDILDTAMRSQFATRVVLANERGQAKLCLNNGDIDVTGLGAGEGYVQFNDYPSPLKIKTRYLAKSELVFNQAAQAARLDLTPQPNEMESKVLAMHAGGANVTAIAIACLGNKGTPQNAKIKAILQKFGKE